MTDNSPATDELIAQIEADIKNGTMGEHHVILSLIARIRAETAKNSGESKVTIVGRFTIDKLLAGEEVEHGSITLIPASDLATPANSRSEAIGAARHWIANNMYEGDMNAVAIVNALSALLQQEGE